MTSRIQFRRLVLVWLVAAAMLCLPVPLSAQGTNIDLPDNRYSVSDDVRLGREAAAQVESRMPILPEGGAVDDYVERVGQRADHLTLHRRYREIFCWRFGDHLVRQRNNKRRPFSSAMTVSFDTTAVSFNHLLHYR